MDKPNGTYALGVSAHSFGPTSVGKAAESAHRKKGS